MPIGNSIQMQDSWKPVRIIVQRFAPDSVPPVLTSDDCRLFDPFHAAITRDLAQIFAPPGIILFLGMELLRLGRRQAGESGQWMHLPLRCPNLVFGEIIVGVFHPGYLLRSKYEGLLIQVVR